MASFPGLWRGAVRNPLVLQEEGGSPQAARKEAGVLDYSISRTPGSSGCLPPMKVVAAWKKDEPIRYVDSWKEGCWVRIASVGTYFSIQGLRRDGVSSDRHVNQGANEVCPLTPSRSSVRNSGGFQP